MTMNISFISPDRRQGVTTTSLLVALALARTQNTTVTYTYTGDSSSSLETFLGVEAETDITRSINQLVKLMESNIVKEDEIENYCTKIPDVKNFMVLNSASSTISPEENNDLVKMAIKNLNTDYVVTDVTTEIFEDVTKEVIEESDLIVMVLTQSRDIWKKVKIWEEALWDPSKEDSPTIMEKLNSKGLIFIFNRYDSYVEAFRSTTKNFNIKHRRCCKITQNPYITRMSNIGKLDQIIEYVIEKDYRVIELNNDLFECVTVIQTNLGRRTLWSS